MQELTTQFVRAWHLVVDALSAPSLQLFLLVGSGVLAASLLALRLTRWGQAKPIWKCVILSIAAHVLLIAYAYGTHLMVSVPAIAVPGPIRVNLVEFLDDQNQSGDSHSEYNDPPISELLLPASQSELSQSLQAIAAAATNEFNALPFSESTLPLPSPANTPEKLDFKIPDQLPPAEMITPAELGDKPSINDSHTPLSRGAEDCGPGAVDSAEPVESEATLPEPAKPVSSDGLIAPHDRLTQELQTQPQPNNDLPFEAETRYPLIADEMPTGQANPKSDPVTRGVQRDSVNRSFSNFDSTDNSMKLIGNLRRMGDGQALPEMYKLRSDENRDIAIRRGGGSSETQRAVELALQWLAKVQCSDGRWDPI